RPTGIHELSSRPRTPSSRRSSATPWRPSRLCWWTSSGRYLRPDVDVTTQVVQAINGWLAELERAVLGPALQAAGQLLFQTPALDSVPSIQTGWQTTRDIADAVFVLALLAGGMLVMASGTFETEYTAKRLLPRMGLAAVLANTSLALCGALIKLDNALVQALLGPSAASTLWTQLTAGAGHASAGGEVLASLVGLATALLAV